MNQSVPFSIWMALLSAVTGYLIGNIQTAIIISQAYFHDDIRNHGSGNAGSTNMVRVFGVAPGAFTFAGDFLKAAVGVLLGRLLMGQLGGYIAGFMVVFGHCYPVFAKFRGGKGVASACGFAFLTNPLGAVCVLAVGVLVFLASKRVSLVSLTGILLFFISVLVLKNSDTALVIVTALILILIYVRHTDNIKRLIHGKEPKLIPKVQ